MSVLEKFKLVELITSRTDSVATFISAMRAVSERRGSTTMTILSGSSENSRQTFLASGI